jgi:hypothetical protein
MSRHVLLSSATLAVALVVTACGGGAASPAPSASTAGSSPDPTATDAILHPTGPDEVVLRFDQAGGFVPMEWIAARLPAFSLYGDGRVVFVQAASDVAARADGVITGAPVRTAVLSEDQVQELLRYALADGGLAIARTEYTNPMVADAPTAVFTINAENDSKTVSAYGLGIEGEPSADTLVLARLAALADRLGDFDRGGSLASDPYLAPAYRGVLIEQQGGVGNPVRDWPWTSITPEDFSLPADPNALPSGTRTLTPDEVAAVGVDGFENGIINGIWLRGPDGRVYSLVIRPLLPDEDA